jgi:hypothetical protein
MREERPRREYLVFEAFLKMIWHRELLRAFVLLLGTGKGLPDYAEAFFAFEDVGGVEHCGDGVGVVRIRW